MWKRESIEVSRTDSQHTQTHLHQTFFHRTHISLSSHTNSPTLSRAHLLSTQKCFAGTTTNMRTVFQLLRLKRIKEREK